jgi:hypothetical protein
MKLFLAFAVWIVMGAIIAKGILSAIHGSYWLLIVAVIGFAALVGKIGCLTHD